MKPMKLVLRCYAEKKDSQWQAFCLDLNLAVQGESAEDVQQRLHSMIATYVHDALVGEDRQYAGQLLSRRAPAKFWAKYYFYCALSGVNSAKNGLHHLFTEVLPVGPLHA